MGADCHNEKAERQTERAKVLHGGMVSTTKHILQCFIPAMGQKIFGVMWATSMSTSKHSIAATAPSPPPQPTLPPPPLPSQLNSYMSASPQPHVPTQDRTPRPFLLLSNSPDVGFPNHIKAELLPVLIAQMITLSWSYWVEGLLALTRVGGLMLLCFLWAETCVFTCLHKIKQMWGLSGLDKPHH